MRRTAAVIADRVAEVVPEAGVVDVVVAVMGEVDTADMAAEAAAEGRDLLGERPFMAAPGRKSPISEL